MRKPKPPKLVTVVVFTTITVIFWIFFEVYDTLTEPPEIEINNELLKPINPTLDIQALNRLETRIYFDQDETANIQITRPTPEPTDTFAPSENPIFTEGESPDAPTPSINPSPAAGE